MGIDDSYGIFNVVFLLFTPFSFACYLLAVPIFVLIYHTRNSFWINY